jgi:pimeloyl-ACP methyl ester carboxylesterase
MTAKALEIPPTPYTGEKARLTRAYDYLILVLALFLFIGAFHLHVALTVGDWDFSVDWKDRQWWPLVTPLMMITFPAAVQSLLWSNFRLPMGATLCISCHLIGSWIARKRLQSAGRENDAGRHRQLVASRHDGRRKAHYDCIKAFSETDFSEDLKAIDVPTMVLHGDDDQIVPYENTAVLAAKLLKHGVLKMFPGLPHIMLTTNADELNAGILKFIREKT